jgi:biotin carboxylase
VGCARGRHPLDISARPLIVLGAGAGQLGAYAAARRLGVETIACDRDPDAFCVREGLVDRFAQVSAMDAGGIREVARRERAGGVISPGTDGPVRVAAEVAAALGLPHPIDPAAAARATDKREQRRAFAREGVPQPAFSEDGSGLPPGARVVVKPAAAQGQRGLAIVEPGGDTTTVAALAARDSRDGHALCEEFVEGPELTVNAFIDAGGRFVPLTVTDRERALAFGVATAHLYPSQYPIADVVAAAEAACRALALAGGPTYTQVLLSPDGPRVMEVAARLGGGHDGELCAAALGVDLSAAAVRAALGQAREPLEPLRDRAAVVRFLIAPPGRLVRVDGLEEARALPGVDLAYVYRAPGMLIEPLLRGPDRAGFVLATGATRAAADATARQAEEIVTFVVE